MIMTLNYILRQKVSFRISFFLKEIQTFFPSIPHRHRDNKNYPKLDAYIGWIIILLILNQIGFRKKLQ
jgi:hypothetical protein